MEVSSASNYRYVLFLSPYNYIGPGALSFFFVSIAGRLTFIPFVNMSATTALPPIPENITIIAGPPVCSICPQMLLQDHLTLF